MHVSANVYIKYYDRVIQSVVKDSIAYTIPVVSVSYAFVLALYV